VLFEIRNQTVKDPLFRSGTRQSPTSVIYLTKIGSNPEPGRTPTPRMGLARLSRNTQHMRLRRPVKRKVKIFRELLLDFMSIGPGQIFPPA
jgi:hypothetical protein